MKNLVLHRVLIICLQRLSLRGNHHHTIPEHEKGHNENLTSGSPPIIRCPGRKTQRRQGRRGEELLARCGRCITYISRKDAQTRAHAPRSSIRLKHIPRPGVNFLVLRCLRSPIHEGRGGQTWVLGCSLHAESRDCNTIERWVNVLEHRTNVGFPWQHFKRDSLVNGMWPLIMFIYFYCTTSNYISSILF